MSEVAAFLGDSAWQDCLNYARKWAAIVIGKPKKCLCEVFWKRLLVNGANDIFGFEFWLLGFLRNNANAGLFAEWDLDDLADCEFFC